MYSLKLLPEFAYYLLNYAVLAAIVLDHLPQLILEFHLTQD